jgi:hypothetical protein
MYFGTMNLSAMQFYDGSFTALVPGVHPLRMIVQYEDEAAVIHQQVYEYHITVEDWGGGFGGGWDGGWDRPGGDWDRPGGDWGDWDNWGDDDGSESGFFGTIFGFIGTHWIWFVAGGGFVVLLTVGIVLRASVFKKKDIFEQ